MQVDELKKISNKIRIDVIKMLNNAGSGHTASSLGLADILTCLYFDILNHNPKKPKMKTRDFLILSNGHAAPVLYTTLAHAGYFSIKKLESLRKINSQLQGHPHNGTLKGIEVTTGSLGQGISQAVGLAASLKRDNKKNKVIVIVGDGEIQEGQFWEALLFASKEKLNNLHIIIDRNNIQIEGNTKNVCKLEPLSKKIFAFNLKVIEFNGNSIKQILHVFKLTKNNKNKPICFIANTTPGCGVSFMENNYKWHGKAPNDIETKKALEELNKNGI